MSDLFPTYGYGPIHRLRCPLCRRWIQVGAVRDMITQETLAYRFSPHDVVDEMITLGAMILRVFTPYDFRIPDRCPMSGVDGTLAKQSHLRLIP